MLSQEAMERGWECLARFSERLSGFGPKYVRAVATEHCVKPKTEMPLTQAEKILGFPIEVISGREEARLIYSGVVTCPNQMKKDW
jgi:exopolyphosphatase/guanosine-5'-triphosphate,3'-diphosphate pyrophosphatase